MIKQNFAYFRQVIAEGNNIRCVRKPAQFNDEALCIE